MARYEPANSFETPRFSGVMTFVRLPNNRDLEKAGCGVVGVRPAYDDPGRIVPLLAANAACEFLGLISIPRKDRHG